MPPIKIDKCRSDFLSSTQRVSALKVLANSCGVISPRGFKRLNRRDSEEIVGLTLLKLMANWESFLEEGFLRYLCGAHCRSGYVPTLINPPSRTLADARAAIYGARDYVSWAPNSTRMRAAGKFAGGDPYDSALGSIAATLTEMTAVRNRIAHFSEYAMEEFRQVVRQRLGFVPRGVTPGSFLLWRPAIPGALCVFEEHVAALVTGAKAIVP